MSKPYVGFLKGGKREYFRSKETPSITSHPEYLAVMGPFRTKAGAMFVVKYGYNNPHVQTVADAERLARKEKHEDKPRSIELYT